MIVLAAGISQSKTDRIISLAGVYFNDALLLQLASIVLKHYVETHWNSLSDKFQEPEPPEQVSAAMVTSAYSRTISWLGVTPINYSQPLHNQHKLSRHYYDTTTT